MKVNKLQDKISELIREETREAEMMGEVMVGSGPEGYYNGVGPDPWSCAGTALKLVAEEVQRLRDEPHTTPPCRRAHTADEAYQRVLNLLSKEG